jgi:predicted phosphodiesterase
VTVPLALVSDIHGNDQALATVVADLERLGITDVVCLGDVAQGGPEPAEVLDRLATLGWPVILGDADAFLLEVPDASPEAITEAQLEQREWTLAQLSPVHLDQIGSFARRVKAALDDGTTLLAFHGSPDDYDEILWPWSPTSEFTAALEGHTADVYAGGHVHQQFVRRIGESQFVNPGSVGLSWDGDRLGDPELRFDHFACYAVVGDGTLELRRGPFDVGPLLESYRESGIPLEDPSLRQWRR